MHPAGYGVRSIPVAADTAKTVLDQATSDHETAQAAVDIAQTTLDEVNAREQAYRDAVKTRQDAEKTLQAAQADTTAQRNRLDELVAALDRAKADEQAALDAWNSALGVDAAAQETLKGVQAAYDTAKATYDAAKAEYDCLIALNQAADDALAALE
ncbi:hypothetical protein [Bifidobacterium thermophilum]|uniref:hypothetical protein n=1 Tax=Bifidobacterium thermophilum TaxID=33905 RepID=UPI003F8D9B1E